MTGYALKLIAHQLVITYQPSNLNTVFTTGRAWNVRLRQNAFDSGQRRTV